MELTVHIAVSLLLIGSGLTAMLADAPRWWRDGLPPEQKWVASDSPTVLEGLSVVLMVLAAIGLFHVLVPNRWSWVLGGLFAAPFALMVPLLLGVEPYGEWVGHVLLAFGIVSLLWPLALTAAGAVRLAHPSTSGKSRWPVLGAVLLLIASPIPVYLTGGFYMVFDPEPWMTVIGLLTALAGVTFLLGRDEPVGQSPPRSAATGSSEAALSAG